MYILNKSVLHWLNSEGRSKLKRGWLVTSQFPCFQLFYKLESNATFFSYYFKINQL